MSNDVPKDQPKSIAQTYFTQLVKQLAAETIKDLRITEQAGHEYFFYWDYRNVTSNELLRGDEGYFDSALEALLDFVLWLQECNDDSMKQLCNLDNDI